MQTTAYVSSNPTRKAELDEQIADLHEHITAATKQLKDYRASAPEAKSLKKYIAERTEETRRLDSQMPTTLFSEAGALADLEQDLRNDLQHWEEAKAKWVAEALINPVYAVENARRIVEEQARVEQVMRLERHWQQTAADDGRTLANFRKAYDEVAQMRKREMMSKLTGRSSTCAFHNAVEYTQGRALAEFDEYRDMILAHLTWYESDAARMPHADAQPPA